MKQIKPLFWEHIFKEYKYIWIVLGSLFLTGVIIGVFMPSYLKIILLEQIFDKFANLLQGADTNWEVAFVIILNNIEVALLLFFLGATLIAPIFIVFSNGLIIGVFFDFIFRLEVFQSGILFSSILSLIPHGIFEIPAFILTASLGVLFIMKIFFPKKVLKKKTRRNVFYDMILRFAFIIMPLFILAALIEAYISPWVGQKADDYVINKYQAEELQEYMPNEIMMAKKHCLIMDKDKADANRNLLAANYTQQLQLIFNDEIFGEYNQYKHIKKYSEDFDCKNREEIQIRIWAMDKYMLNHYLALHENMLKEAGLEVTLIKNNIYKVTSDTDSYFFAYKEKDEGVYFLVNYFGEDRKLLKKILK